MKKINKSNLLSILKITLTALVVSLIASYAYAGTWTPPTATPPGSNLYVPVHTGTGAQVKPEGLSVDVFAAAQAATFHQDVFVRGPIFGGFPGSVYGVMIGGVDGSVNRTVSAEVSGKYSGRNLGSTTLINTTNKEVCANTSGLLVFCQ